MALSNIFRAPRKEITETLVGLAAVSPVITFAVWMTITLHSEPNPAPRVIAALWAVAFTVAAAWLGLLAVTGVHALGEALCAAWRRRESADD